MNKSIFYQETIMPRCSAFQCENKGVHCFPADKIQKNLWIKALRLKNWSNNSSATSARICDDHFKPDDYEATCTGVKYEHKNLKKDAVPSRFLFSKQDAMKPTCQTGYQPQILVNSAKLDSSQMIHETNTNASNKGLSIKKHGQCRCCLKKDLHSVRNIWELLQCFNVEVSTDPRISLLVCSDCGKFLQQARQFCNMVAASQRTLLSAIHEQNDDNVDEKPFTVKVELTSVHMTDSDSCQVKKEEIKEQNVGENCAVPTEQDGAIHDDGRMEEDRGHSDHSDDTDVEMNIKETNVKLTPREVKNEQKLIEARLNLQIRENLSTILHHSTITPFTKMNKGDNYECIYCEKNYTHFKDLKNHVQIHHNEEFEFKLQALKMYALKHDPELILRVDVSNISCRICGKRFATIDNFVEHLVEIHNKKYHVISRDPPHNVLCFDMSLDVFKCLDCDKVFAHFRGLLMHMNQHYGSYLCPECGSKFLYERSFKIHMFQKARRGRPRAKCSQCDATYSRSNHLKRHVKLKHPEVSQLVV